MDIKSKTNKMGESTNYHQLHDQDSARIIHRSEFGIILAGGKKAEQEVDVSVYKMSLICVWM